MFEQFYLILAFLPFKQPGVRKAPLLRRQIRQIWPQLISLFIVSGKSNPFRQCQQSINIQFNWKKSNYNDQKKKVKACDVMWGRLVASMD